jgi:hypothetical protein
MLYAMSDALIEQSGVRPPPPTFAAVLVAAIDLARSVLSYAAAGVEGGLIFGDRLAHLHLVATGPLLGIQQRPRNEERTMHFLPGDALIAYTDGITEAPTVKNNAPFGTSGLVRCLRQMQPRSGGLTMRALWKQIGPYTGHVYDDDATLAIVTAPMS